MAIADSCLRRVASYQAEGSCDARGTESLPADLKNRLTWTGQLLRIARCAWRLSQPGESEKRLIAQPETNV
eukprot:CAMPEP_0171242206 /NCGR_PEP_ID=MMETSP0790-20130122/45548_1 /TAXON_ID=2925 /ORGANISM="Alexandrium catenella, Strain OF101" /LENGTH=70 /DNA_ID=CAMNT_0011708953 /DNA_START=1 /DNA_END=210 /DNA_ORIENTATION=+